MSNKNKPPYFSGNKNNLVYAERKISMGPLPSADELAKYEAIKPGITDIFINTYQKQANHRMDIESRVVNHNNANATRGQIFAFAIVLVAIVCGCVLIIYNKDAAGLSTIIIALASLVGVFVYGRSQERKERLEKAKQVPEIK